MTPSRNERRDLVAAMRAVGPDAPTMCKGWTTRELAVHLVLRERRLDVTAGMVLPPLRSRSARITREYRDLDWAHLLRLVESGPPWYSPFAPVDQLLNVAEMFVHHEDVLRGGVGREEPWLPRELDPKLSSALEMALQTVGRLTLAKAPVRVTLGSTDGRTLLSAGHGGPVTVTGTVGELVLFAFGRAPVDVQVTGSEAAVAALLGTSRAV